MRARAVMARTSPAHDVRLFCSGAAWPILNGLPQVEEVDPCNPGSGTWRAFRRRLVGDLERLSRISPRLVVSDGDGPSVHAAAALRIPVLAIGHGLIFRHVRHHSPLPRGPLWREIVNSMTSSWPAQRRVAVHFAPAEPRTEGTTVARPDLPLAIPLDLGAEDFILAYFRDDDGTEVVEQLVDRGHRVVLFGRLDRPHAKVEVRAPDVEDFFEALVRCRAVVGSAGNQLPAECAMLAKPMLALHGEDDVEQRLNAQLVEAAGIGIGGALHDCTPLLLRRFEAELDKPRDELAVRTRAMLPVSEVVPLLLEEMLD